MNVEIETLREEDRARRVQIGRQAFSGTATFDADAPDFDLDQVVGAYAADRLVGAVSTHDFGMHWGGSRVPCGGVGGVSVMPEVRGQNVARRMLAESFARMRERGEVVSALYPTTARLYRSVGYEFAGWWRRSTLDLEELAGGDDPALEWEPAPFDHPDIPATYEAMAVDHDGWLSIPDRMWAHRAHTRTKSDANRFAYVATRDGRVVASLVFHYNATQRPGKMYDLEVEHLAGTDAAAVGGCLGFLARHGTTVGTVTTTLPAEVLAPHVPHLQRMVTAMQWAWMIRLVDLPGAMAARGWPTGVAGSVAFDVTDPVIPENSGPGVLTVADGTASWEPGGAGTVEVTIQELGALYAGCNPRVLAAGGQLRGAGRADLDLLRASFAANPSAIDFF